MKHEHVIEFLRLTIEEQKSYIETARREGMPKMEKFYRKSIAQKRSAIKALRVAEPVN